MRQWLPVNAEHWALMWQCLDLYSVHHFFPFWYVTAFMRTGPESEKAPQKGATEVPSTQRLNCDQSPSDQLSGESSDTPGGDCAQNRCSDTMLPRFRAPTESKVSKLSNCNFLGK